MSAPFALSEVVRKTCTVPRCLERRRKRGQTNGQFLFAYRWTERGIIIELPCPECGTNHQIEIAKPE